MDKVKLEFVARITLPSGEVIERKVTAADGMPAPDDFDISSTDGFLESFDAMEKVTLEARNRIAKDIAEAYLEEVSKKKQIITTSTRIHRVESEIGRLCMPNFKDVISTLKPKERVWSISFSRLCLDFCSEISYRRVTDRINAVLHRSSEDSLKVRTLTDFVERVGSKIQDYLAAFSETVLDVHHFELEAARSEDGPPISDVAAKPKPTTEQKIWEDEIAKKAEEINAQRPGREQIKDLRSLPYMESPKEKCCYISIDDIGVKHQKETRKDGGSKSVKYVQNTVVHIQNDGGSYCLTASSMDEASRILLAFLLSNNLLWDYTLVFLADGAVNIKDDIEKYFSFHPYILILDWYHLKKKCKELISMSLKGTKEQKKDYIKNILRMLWVGNVQEAIFYLNGLDISQIKSNDWLKELIGYLGRKQAQIICYALRFELGLRISSNRVEKANDLLVAQRQKHGGMSWSFEGSHSLASIAMVMQNKEMEQWLRTGSISCSMPASVAA